MAKMMKETDEEIDKIKMYRITSPAVNSHHGVSEMGSPISDALHLYDSEFLAAKKERLHDMEKKSTLEHVAMHDKAQNVDSKKGYEKKIMTEFSFSDISGEFDGFDDVSEIRPEKALPETPSHHTTGNIHKHVHHHYYNGNTGDASEGLLDSPSASEKKQPKTSLKKKKKSISKNKSTKKSNTSEKKQKVAKKKRKTPAAKNTETRIAMRNSKSCPKVKANTKRKKKGTTPSKNQVIGKKTKKKKVSRKTTVKDDKDGEMNFGTSISVVVRGAEESGDIANVASTGQQNSSKDKKKKLRRRRLKKNQVVASKAKGKPKRLGIRPKKDKTHRWQAWSGYKPDYHDMCEHVRKAFLEGMQMVCERKHCEACLHAMGERRISKKFENVINRQIQNLRHNNRVEHEQVFVSTISPSKQKARLSLSQTIGPFSVRKMLFHTTD